MEENKNIPKIIITDTHFGVKNNSINFLKSQKLLFDDLCDWMQTYEPDRFDLVHLGDLFDSRASLSVYIMSEVKNLLIRLNNILKERNKDNKFIFVAGNHDFYSPTSDTVNSLDIIVRDTLPDAVIVDKDVRIDGNDIYIPWYWMNEPEKFNHLDLTPYKRIFTHCDCHDFEYGKIPVNSSIFSGHIHQFKSYHNILSSNPTSSLYNLSTPYSLDYGDNNDDNKGWWELIGDTPILHKNKRSIKFKTFINDQIFDIEDLDISIERGDNFRLFISESNRSKIEYIEKINELSTDIKYLTIILTNDNIVNVDEAISNLDINNMLEGMIPEHLKDKFEIVKNEIHNNEY